MGPNGNRFKVIPGTINHISVLTKTVNTEEKRAVVNAVGKCQFFLILIILIDSQTGDLIYSWMFLLKSLPPTETMRT